MRKVLNFIGTGTAFSKENINNAAIYRTNDKLVLFDCAETTFHELIKQNIINENVKTIDVIITRFLTNNVGSLGTLVLYCEQNKIKINIIYPNKEMPYSLLSLFGINAKLYQTKTPNEVEDYYLKEYIHPYEITTTENNVVNFPSYGYHFIKDNDNFYYNLDIKPIADELITMFKNKKIYYLYQSCPQNGNELELLKNQIEEKDRKRIMFMHLYDSYDLNELKNLGFETAR